MYFYELVQQTVFVNTFCNIKRITINSVPVLKLARSLLVGIQASANSLLLTTTCLVLIMCVCHGFTGVLVQGRIPARAHLHWQVCRLLISTPAAVTVAVSSRGRFQPFVAQISSFIFIWAVTLFYVWWTRNLSADIWKYLVGWMDGSLQGARTCNSSNSSFDDRRKLQRLHKITKSQRLFQFRLLPQPAERITAQFHQVQGNLAKRKCAKLWNMHCWKTANSSKENKYTLSFCLRDPTDRCL